MVGKTFETHIANLQRVFVRFREHGLKLKPQKCFLFRKEVKFLGRMISENGVAVNPDNVEAVVKWPIPKNVKDVESFLGFVNYHRDHIKDYAELAAPLYALTGRKEYFLWQAEHQQAFENLRAALVCAATLSIPNTADLFVLDTDASDLSIGAELSQIQGGIAKVIGYGSMVLTPPQRKYCTTRKELLAVITFTRRYRHYLLGRRFILRTDHNSLIWLLSFRNIQGQLARWIEELAQYDMEVQHRPGKKHSNADVLSRLPDPLPYCPNYLSGCTLSALPCGGCSFCSRAEKQWKHFEECVDDILPIAVREIRLEEHGETIETLEEEDEEEALEENEQFGEVEDDTGSGEPLRKDFLTDWPGYTSTDLCQLQENDADLSVIISWMKEDKKPSAQELFLCSPTVKHLWSCKNYLFLQNKVLYYRWDDQEDKVLLVVPRSLKDEVLRYCHDNKLSGHLGQAKTVLKVKQRFFWHGLQKDCITFVKSCDVCSKYKRPNRKAKSSLGSYHAGAPLERVHIDILGPLAASESGNKFVLMVVDQFTKWIECYPLKDQSAETIAYKVTNEFFSRFGCPLQIHTDQGRNFDGNLFNALCSLLEITKSRTTPYRPCSNGQVERYNRLMLQIIRCFIKGKQQNWDQHIQLAAAAIRSMENRQTGFTPNFLMFGRELLQPVDLLFGTANGTQRWESAPEYIKQLWIVIEEAHRNARETLQTTQHRQKRDYDLKLHQSTYEVGDLVYKLDLATKKGRSKKLQAPWIGPYLVVKVEFPLIRIKGKKREEVVHHDRLKICENRVVPLWLKKSRHDLLGREQDEELVLVQSDELTLSNDSTDQPDLPYAELEDLTMLAEHVNEDRGRPQRDRRRPLHLQEFSVSWQD